MAKAKEKESKFTGGADALQFVGDIFLEPDRKFGDYESPADTIAREEEERERRERRRRAGIDTGKGKR